MEFVFSYSIWPAPKLRIFNVAAKKTAINEIDWVKKTIRKFIFAINYTTVVVICFALVAQPEMPILDRALYGFGAIFIGIIIRRVVKSLMPLAEDNMAGK